MKWLPEEEFKGDQPSGVAIVTYIQSKPCLFEVKIRGRNKISHLCITYSGKNIYSKVMKSRSGKQSLIEPLITEEDVVRFYNE